MSLIPNVIEHPHATLSIDPVRYDPNEISRRLIAVTNALMERFKDAGNLRADLAGETVRKGDEYKAKRGGLYRVEAEIESLSKKYDALRTIIYMKTTEIKHFMG